MFNWLSQMIIVTSMVIPYATSTSTKFESLPIKPTQDQIECRTLSWEKENLTTVASAQIDKKLAPYIEKLIADARLSGNNFVINSGYRTCVLQASLRVSSCGGSDNYNKNLKPADLCSPPTEPAGRSLHNDGLAVDFACQGYGVLEYSPCYSWLQKNAFKYQLINRPGEPWHWSTTGR